MRIIANHAHVFQKEVRPHGTIDVLKNLMDECEIEKAVAFAPFPKHFSYEEADSNPNRWLTSQIKSEDRLYGFGVIDFDREDIADQVKEVYDLGLNGIKLHPSFQHFALNCRKAYTVYDTAEKLGLPISFHTGVHRARISESHLLLFDDITFSFPNLKFTMEHVGGYSFFNEAVAVMTNNPKNTYAGLTSVFDRGTNRCWYLGNEKVEELLWQTDENRSIFGLDFPYNGVTKVKEAISCVKSLNISDEAKQKILGDNLLKFMRT